jgi:sugar-specific transcriptional regulator TrmB
MANESLSLKRRQFLHDIGLSHDAIALYQLLLARKTLTAHEASIELHTFASATYRLFYKLEQWGLARRIAGRPLSFTSVPKAEGMAIARKTYDAHLARLLQKAGPSEDVTMSLIIGRKALYDRYEVLAKKAEHQVLVYSIGIAFSDSLYAVQQDAIQRGVSIKHIVQQLRPVNYHVVTKWQRLGVHVRHNPSERGFHFMLFDGKLALISFSDPHDTENRLSIQTDNRTAILLFESQFNELWASSRQLKP